MLTELPGDKMHPKDMSIVTHTAWALTSGRDRGGMAHSGVLI